MLYIEKKEENKLKLFGVLFIILGIITFVVTYEHVFPIGSVVLILCGSFLIFWGRYQNWIFSKDDRYIYSLIFWAIIMIVLILITSLALISFAEVKS